MEINRTEFITLQSINPADNRYRGYRISVTPVETTKIRYAVSCSWGRIPDLTQSKHFIFDDENEVEKQITSILHKRKLNDYSIVDRSRSFPAYPVLEGFPERKILSYQGLLFREVG